MNVAVRKGVAGLLAFVGVVVDTVGLPSIYTAKARIRENIIRNHNLRNRNVIKERSRMVVGYNNNSIKDREILRKDKLGLDSEWKKGRWFIEAHDASHFHHDFSIVVNNKVYRMARTPSKDNIKSGFLGLFPGPGEKTGWILQPEHYPNEVPNPGIIDDGYGAGTSKVIGKGTCYVRLSDGDNIEVVFDKIPGLYVFLEKDNQVMVLRKISALPKHPNAKYKMKDGKVTNLEEYIESDEWIAIRKYNGAFVEWEVDKASNGNKYLKIWSWRPDARFNAKYGTNVQIEHTYRLEVSSKKLPSGFPICSGRAELYIDSDIGLGKLNPILTSSIFNGIEENLEQPRFIITDVTYHENYPDIGQMHYGEKLAIIMDLYKKSGKRFEVPEYAYTKEGKKSLWMQCKDDQPRSDGVIFRSRINPEANIIKMKFKHDESNFHNATIIGFEPQTGQHGDKYAYPIVKNEYGYEFKLAGIGMTNELKSDMYKNPQDYISRNTIYSAEQHYEETGAPFQPLLIRIE